MKTSEIYVYLQNEGTSVWRPVEAKHIVNNIYKIISKNMYPDEEKWQFEYGDYVRCRDKTDPDSKILKIAFVRIEKYLVDLIPKDKYDIDKIEDLNRAGILIYKPILLDLFTWIQDINWPIATKIIPILLDSGLDSVPVMKYILESNDDVWKLWCITEVMNQMPKSVLENVLPEIKKIAESPTVNEKDEEVDIAAKKLLIKFGVINSSLE